MSTYPCDQVAADTLAVRDEIKAKHEIEIHFSLEQITAMVDEYDNAVSTGVITDYEELLEAVLGRYNYLHDIEYTAYKMVLGRIFKRRLGARSSMNSTNGKFRPFAPIEAYEP